MTERVYDVEITITRTVRVQIPTDLKNRGETMEDFAEEVALGGKSTWPQFVVSQDDDCSVESIIPVRIRRSAA